MTWTPDDLSRLKALRDRRELLTWDQMSEYEDALVKADPLSHIEELGQEVERLKRTIQGVKDFLDGGCAGTGDSMFLDVPTFARELSLVLLRLEADRD